MKSFLVSLIQGLGVEWCTKEQDETGLLMRLLTKIELFGAFNSR